MGECLVCLFLMRPCFYLLLLVFLLCIKMAHLGLTHQLDLSYTPLKDIRELLTIFFLILWTLSLHSANRKYIPKIESSSLLENSFAEH
jgi:hypothetical protein